ncbi:MAG: 4Fe-4S binding protein, partial [Candidatus Fimenecus sp.]|nr:4Fe-4S binding protein [Candidatus Fimenecus sp.]
SLRDGKATAEDRCTMCYRCISRCPQKAITLLGDEVIEQCRFEKYGSWE